ncbi:unnamed protein product [Choristocarpus tenellus]
MEVRHQSASLSDANMGQLTPRQKEQFVELFEEFRNLGVFPEDPKRVPPYSRGVLHIPLVDESCTAYAAKQRLFSPEETQAEVKQLQECGIIRPSTSAWAAAVVAVGKKVISHVVIAGVLGILLASLIILRVPAISQP